ncbi:hypothetical protein EB809_19305 [Marinobacter sp. R17]|uniref:DUF6933 domain-containing protein n=1 Tax=Marinobacter sp. R17 TaxID=2484250 RepID=UPI000F4B3E4F|nr:hypothetical protein [Marinobacter sp. R17]ROT94536.1 hypothetical protein EB809_19305 [Marinobacter sp. R17]
MQLIKCTGKLRKEMGVADGDLHLDEIAGDGLGPWHANLLYISGRKCVLCANDKTLIHFIVPDVRRAEVRQFQAMFLQGLETLLLLLGVADAQRASILPEYADVHIGKSNSRSVLGSMNDLAFQYEFLIRRAGGLYAADVPGIIYELNQMPMRCKNLQSAIIPRQAFSRYCETAG